MLICLPWFQVEFCARHTTSCRDFGETVLSIMDFLQPSEIGGYTLDDVEEMFSALVDTCKDEPVSPQQELSPGKVKAVLSFNA